MEVRGTTPTVGLPPSRPVDARSGGTEQQIRADTAEPEVGANPEAGAKASESAKSDSRDVAVDVSKALGPRGEQPSASKYEVGQRIDGVVVSVHGGGLATIRAAGQMITALSPHEQLQVGQKLKLEVTDNSGGTILAVRVNAAETSILNRLGFPLTDENISLVSELLAQGRPIDAELLAQLSRNASEVKLFLAEQGVEAFTPGQANEPLKQLLLSMLSARSGSGAASRVSNAAYGAGMDPANGAGVFAPQGTEGDVNRSDGSALADALAEALLASASEGEGTAESGVSGGSSQRFSINATNIAATPALPSEAGVSARILNLPAPKVLEDVSGALKVLVQIAEAATQKLGDIGNGVPGQQAAEASAQTDADAFQSELTKLLKSFGPKENLLLTNNKDALTVKNIALASLNKTELADVIRNLADEFPNNAAKIREALETLSDRSKSAESKISELARIAGNKNVETLLKELPAMSRQENPHIYYIPVPVRLENENKSVEMYYKKRATKTDEINILVALKTKHIGEVRCMVTHGQDSGTRLTFSLEDDRIRQAFSSQVSQLKKSLAARGTKVVDIQFARNVKEQFFGANAGSNPSGGFDVRV